MIWITGTRMKAVVIFGHRLQNKKKSISISIIWIQSSMHDSIIRVTQGVPIGLPGDDLILSFCVRSAADNMHIQRTT